jgi:hypothetical protein
MSEEKSHNLITIHMRIAVVHDGSALLGFINGARLAIARFLFSRECVLNNFVQAHLHVTPNQISSYEMFQDKKFRARFNGQQSFTSLSRDATKVDLWRCKQLRRSSDLSIGVFGILSHSDAGGPSKLDYLGCRRRRWRGKCDGI